MSHVTLLLESCTSNFRPKIVNVKSMNPSFLVKERCMVELMLPASCTGWRCRDTSCKFVLVLQDSSGLYLLLLLLYRSALCEIATSRMVCADCSVESITVWQSQKALTAGIGGTIWNCSLHQKVVLHGQVLICHYLYSFSARAIGVSAG